MTNPVEIEVSSTATQEAIDLLRPEIEPELTEAGYIDLLGEQDLAGSRPLERAMGSGMVSQVYERFWRPIAARVMYGMLGPGFAKEQRIALDMLEVSRGDRVLDVGCGPGTFTRGFAREASDGLVVGFDASEVMLAAAVRRDPGSNLAYVRGDACALPFGDAAFDAICCFGALHLVDEPMAALGEMDRVLAPGGRLGLSTSYLRKDPMPKRRDVLRQFRRDEITGALADRGFVDIGQRLSGWGQLVSARKRRG